MTKTNYEEKIERGLKLFLKEEYGVTAISAFICESEVERGWSDGCETCGYGSDEDTVTTPIYYKEEKFGYTRQQDIKGTSINFLPQLLDYIDRAN